MDYYFLRYPIPYYKDPTDRRSNHQDVIAGMKSGKYLSDKEWANLKEKIKKKNSLPQGTDYHRHGKYYMQYSERIEKSRYE